MPCTEQLHVELRVKDKKILSGASCIMYDKVGLLGFKVYGWACHFKFKVTYCASNVSREGQMVAPSPKPQSKNHLSSKPESPAS